MHLQVAFIAFIIAPGAGAVFARVSPSHFPLRFAGYWAIGAAGDTIVALVLRRWTDALLFALSLAVALLWDRWNRKGKRAAKTLGAKSKAVIDGMVKRVRESAPAPVPQGVPG